MIVKVQLSQSPYHVDALVYNQDRSVETVLPVTKELLESMQGEEKAYFHAHLEKDKKIKNGGYISLDRKCEWQNW